MSVATIEYVPTRIVPRQSAFDFRRRVPALDGLRGVAILSVFFHNYGGGLLRDQAAFLHTASPILRFLAKIVGSAFAIGWVGVALFFVLSGFLITGILYDTRKDVCYYRNFYARRALRIFPVYYVFAGILVVIGHVVHARWHPADLFFLVYLGFPAAFIWPAAIQVAPALHFTHLWSLCVEEQFYLLWPTLVIKFKNVRGLMWLCVGAIALSIAFRTIVCAMKWPVASWSYAFLIGRIDELAIGAALAISVRTRRDVMERWSLRLLLVSLGVISVICILRHTFDSRDPVISSIGYTFIGLACGGILIRALSPASLTQRLLSLQLLRIFGKYSYGMYVYHAALTVVLSPIRAVFAAHIGSFFLANGIYLGLAIGLNLAMAALSYHVFEARVMRWKAQFTYSSTQEASLVAVV